MKKYFLAFLFVSFSVIAQTQKDCSKCSSEIIDENNLKSFDSYALKILKNEIYARKGYTFSNQDYSNYFKKFTWYKPLNNNEKIKFSDIETQNIEIINQTINQISQLVSTQQNSKYKTLSEEKIKEIFTSKRKKDLGINYLIWKVYDYQDKTGKYFLVLTEDKFDEPIDGRPNNNAIKAFNFKVEKEIWTKTFETNDAKNGDEASIWFWSRYIYVEDFDNDGIIEPILFYGTNGDNARVKILIYYKGKKIGIRIQNGDLDYQRNFSVDADLYKLPKKIQDTVKEQMSLIATNGNSILPYGWEKKMAKKMTLITE